MEQKNYNTISQKLAADKVITLLKKFPELTQFSETLISLHLKGYLIGGTIRDLMLQRPIKDIDIAINTNPKNFLKKFNQKIKGHIVCLDQEYQIYRFIIKDRRHFDISPLKGDDILQDLVERDFTVNAMAISLNEIVSSKGPALIDPCRGVKDIADGIIKMVTNKVFRNDPLRILRAFRLSGHLHFTIDGKTEFLIYRDKELLKNVAPERIREELFMLFSLSECKDILIALLNQDIITDLLMQKFPQEKKERQKNLLGKGTSMVHNLEMSLLNLPSSTIAEGKKLDELFSQIIGHQTTCKPLLKLAALLLPIYDSEKNNEKSEDFILHSLDSLLKSLCLTNSQQKYVLSCLKSHREVIELFQKNSASPKYFYRFFHNFGEAGLGALMLSMAKIKTEKIPSESINTFEEFINTIIRFYFDWQKVGRRPLLDGNFLVNYFHLPQGPIIGELINYLQEARAEGKIIDKKEAINLAKQFLEQR